MSPELVEQYYLGLKDGVRLYAWWKNGKEYVGAGLVTLERALQEIDQERQATLEFHRRVP